MTKHDTPVSLAILWQRWQEIEKLPEHNDKILAERNAIENQIIDQPAETSADLFAKLKFLAHLARDHDWNDRIEKLYGSIEDAQRNQLNGRDPLSRIEDELIKIKGIGECLESISRHAPEPAKVCDYLGGQLLEHVEGAYEALNEISTDRRTKRDFFRNAITPKPEDAQRELANLVTSAWPKITVCEVEGARQMLQFMLDALPAPIPLSSQQAAEDGGAT
jgi:hypothetical protein